MLCGAIILFIYSGSLKYSTIERAIQKVTNNGASGKISLSQFVAFIDELQSNVNYDEIDVDNVVASVKVAETETETETAEGRKPSKSFDAPLDLTLGLQSSKVCA